MKNQLISRACVRSLALVLLVVAVASLANLTVAGTQPIEVYGTAADGAPLHWVVFTPAGNGPWPAVLVIHPGEFKGGAPWQCPNMLACAADLAAAGYLALSIEYRLAPNGSIAGQVSDGRFPDQTDDVRLAVLAARADPRCDGRVGAIGGSAGASHAAYLAGTGTIGADRVDVAIALSGGYDFTDFSDDPNIKTFKTGVTNYVGVDETDTAALRAASPAYLADRFTSPLFLVNTEQDPMPFSQLGDMTAALDALGVTNYKAVSLPGDAHAFDNWVMIKDQGLAFFSSWFNGGPPPPTPTPSPTATPSSTPTPSPTSSATPGPDPSPTTTPPPLAGPPPSKVLLNLSTRVQAGSGDNVMIGGFIVTGSQPKKVAVRALGPSLAKAGVTGGLSDPALELHDSTGALIAKNDDWTSLPAELIPAGLQLPDSHESLIVTTLSTGSYTGVVYGADGSAGVALIELYDLDAADSTISNISTRGEVGSGNSVMIGGFIIGGEEPTKVIVRAIGPSLQAKGIANFLPDPVLDLYDSQGSLLFTNDNWRDTQEQQVTASGIPPSNDSESAIVATLAAGGYTAIVRDSTGKTGVGLVEVYNLDTK